MIGKLGFVIGTRIDDKGAGFEVETMELKDSCVDFVVFGCSIINKGIDTDPGYTADFFKGS